MGLYSETIMEHFMYPRNAGSIGNPDGMGEAESARCGDHMKICLKVENDRISDAKFDTYGCGSAIAAASMATEAIRGKSVYEVMDILEKTVSEVLSGLPAYKSHCAALAAEAIRNALLDYFDRNGIPHPKERENLKKKEGRG